jgi:hypothetical protein
LSKKFWILDLPILDFGLRREQINILPFAMLPLYSFSLIQNLKSKIGSVTAKNNLQYEIFVLLSGFISKEKP